MLVESQYSTDTQWLFGNWCQWLSEQVTDKVEFIYWVKFLVAEYNIMSEFVNDYGH